MSTPHDLRQVDLNLLVALDALIDERSVTRAAERIGVTQSAMSHTLRRLRELFDDPLLVRGRGGMVPTPRALALAVPVRSGLVTLQRALDAPETFEPATAARAFRIAAPDIVEVLVLPGLLARLRQVAPGVDLTLLPAPRRSLHDDLETGAVDLAILARPQLEEPGSLVAKTLLRDGMSCFVRADHPAIAAGGSLDLATYTALSHALVSPLGEGPGMVDQLLAEHGLTRRVALRLPHFYAALSIVAGTDLVLTAPSTLARLIPAGSPLTVLDAPLPIPPHAVAMVWHPRFSDDPAHRWFRDLVALQMTSTSGTTALGG